MPKMKLIARYSDGRMVKGYTDNFNPNGQSFHIQPVGVDARDSFGTQVSIRDLKAVFVVKTFEGRQPDEEPQDDVQATPPTPGTVLEVTFKDGEKIVGTSMTYDPNAIGFFIFPVDPESNNLRIFVINQNIAQVDYIPIAQAG